MIPGTINVVVVDDHAIFRSGLKADLDERLRVTAEADTVETAIAAIREHRPAVVLLDVHLPGGAMAGLKSLPAAGICWAAPGSWRSASRTRRRTW